MRKFLGPGLLLCAVFAGCETKTPTGPSGNTPTTTTTTTSVPGPAPTTTTSTTTTSSVLGSLARRYTTFQPPPNVPADMTLFFELIQAAPAASPTGFTSGRNAVTENEYKVTGVYVMNNGTTGTVTGELGGSLNPLETGGEFKGSLTATAPSGCTALRDFAGVITPTTLQWTGGAVGTTSNPCSPNPLTAFSNLSMLLNDANAPLPTPPSTTSSISTTTTTVACTYSLSPTSDLVGSAGGVRTVNVTAPAGCTWSAQSFAPFITINPPYGGSGSATVTYNVAATTAARTGSLLIAGIQFPVVQSAPVTTTTTSTTSTTTTSVVPLADLIPDPPVGVPVGTVACRTDTGGNLLIGVRNLGPGGAGMSLTRVVFSTVPPVTTDVITPAVASGSVTDVPFAIPGSCFSPDCLFSVTVNVDRAVSESSTANNGANGFCLG
jgi:hypothetical protein